MQRRCDRTILPPRKLDGDNEHYFLPSCWDTDEERMSSLMSMFKRREVNPTEYDAKLRFWTGLITSSCSVLKNPFITHKQLCARFQRKDRLPACLETVLTHMYSRGTIVPLTDYVNSISKQRGWISWGLDVLVKRPLSWAWNFAANNNDDVSSIEFVLPSVIREIGDEILRRRKEALENNDIESNPLCQDIVPFSTLLRVFRDDQLDERALDIALSHLHSEGQIAMEMIGTRRGNEKLIKFKAGNELDAPKMTEVDRQMLNVKNSALALERDMTSLDQQVDRLDKEARTHIRAGNRSKAKMCLKQKLLLLKRLKEKEDAYDNLTAIMNQLAQTKEQRAVLDAYKSGVAAFKGNLAKHGLSTEMVDKTMDDIHEVLSDQEDIRTALSSTTFGLDVGQDDLERELNDLLEQDNKEKRAVAEKRPVVLPDVPTFEREESEVGSMDDRLKRLRRALEAS